MQVYGLVVLGLQPQTHPPHAILCQSLHRYIIYIAVMSADHRFHRLRGLQTIQVSAGEVDQQASTVFAAMPRRAARGDCPTTRRPTRRLQVRG